MRVARQPACRRAVAKLQLLLLSGRGRRSGGRGNCCSKLLQLLLRAQLLLHRCVLRRGTPRAGRRGCQTRTAASLSGEQLMDTEALAAKDKRVLLQGAQRILHVHHVAL